MGSITETHPTETHTDERWFCPPCGAVYDPAAGDASAGIEAGTAFEDLPHEWRCPVCRSLKCDYVPLGRSRITGRV